MKTNLIALVPLLVAFSVIADVLEESNLVMTDVDPTLVALEGTRWQRIDQNDSDFTLSFSPMIDGEGDLSFSGQAHCNRYIGYFYPTEKGLLGSWKPLMTCFDQEEAFVHFMVGPLSLELEGQLLRLFSEGVGPMVFKKFSDNPFFDIAKLGDTQWKTRFWTKELAKPTTVHFAFSQPSTLHYVVLSETGYIVSGSFVEHQTQVGERLRYALHATNPIVFGEADINLEERAELEELLKRISKTAGFYVFGGLGERSLRWVDKSGKVIIGGFEESPF